MINIEGRAMAIKAMKRDWVIFVCLWRVSLLGR